MKVHLGFFFAQFQDVLTEELCPSLVRVQRLHLLHVLGGHIKPQLGALLAVERRGDALLHVTSRRTHRGQTSDAAGTQRAMQTQVDCASSLRAAYLQN